MLALFVDLAIDIIYFFDDLFLFPKGAPWFVSVGYLSGFGGRCPPQIFGFNIDELKFL